MFWKITRGWANFQIVFELTPCRHRCPPALRGGGEEKASALDDGTGKENPPVKIDGSDDRRSPRVGRAGERLREGRKGADVGNTVGNNFMAIHGKEKGEPQICDSPLFFW